MKSLLKVFCLCGVLLPSIALMGGCSRKSAAQTEFEQQIRAPKGPPPPEAQAAMEKAMAEERAKMAAGSNAPK